MATILSQERDRRRAAGNQEHAGVGLFEAAASRSDGTDLLPQFEADAAEALQRRGKLAHESAQKLRTPLTWTVTVETDGVLEVCLSGALSSYLSPNPSGRDGLRFLFTLISCQTLRLQTCTFNQVDASGEGRAMNLFLHEPQQKGGTDRCH